MRPRNTLFLVLLLAAIVGYLYFVEREKIADEQRTDTVLDVEADAVTAVTLTYPDREIVVERRDGAWHMTKPVDAEADAVMVQNLVRGVAEAELKKTIDAPADLAPFGLAPPQVTVTLTAGERTLPAIRVGKDTAVGFMTYVQRDDTTAVQLTGSGFRTSVDKQPKDLRDKTILRFADDAVDAITLRGREGAVELAKVDGAWSITAPTAYRADNNAVRALLSTLRNLRATDFAAEAPDAAALAGYGLEPPQREIALRAGDTPITLAIGAEFEQGLYVRAGDRPTVFVIGKWASGDLDKGVNELRDKTLLTFDPTQATAITVTRGGTGAYTLQAAGGRWSLAGSDQPLDAAAVDAFVGALSRLTGTQVLSADAGDPAAWGLAPPAVTIDVRGDDGALLGTIRAGSHSPDPPATQYTAMRDGDPAVFQLRDDQFRQLDQQAGDFVAAPAAPPPPAAPAASDE